jgi:hypothetical protein
MIVAVNSNGDKQNKIVQEVKQDIQVLAKNQVF